MEHPNHHLTCHLDPLLILTFHLQEQPKPRSWLNGEEAWAQARREVETRRARKKEEEGKQAEEAMRRKERGESMAGREEWSRKLDRQTAEDWAFQVLLKERLKKQDEEDDMRNVVEEREEVRRLEIIRKDEERKAAVEEMRGRSEQGNRARKEKEEAKFQLSINQGGVREENRKEAEEEEREKELERRRKAEVRQGLGALLRSQIGGEEGKRMKEKEERELVEGKERKRQEELVVAGRVEKMRKERECGEEKAGFLVARRGFHEQRVRGARQEAIATIGVNRRVEDVIQELEEQRAGQRQKTAGEVARVLELQMEEKLSLRKKEAASDWLEQEERLVSEKRVKEEEVLEARQGRERRAEYRVEVLAQQTEDRRRKEEVKRRVETEDAVVAQYYRRLAAIDAREMAVPLPSFDV